MEKYKKIRPFYEALTSRVEQLIGSLLNEEKIDYHLIESRTKKIESFENKIRRNPNKYHNPLKEITDLSGIRIILYYQNDLEKVDKILRENFEIDYKNTIDKKKILKNNEFGYLSYHYVCSVDSARSKLPEWKSFNKMKFEIQVRTVLQHAWAAISHEIDYKSNIEIPSILKRKLFRLAGLIELADEEFQEVRYKHNKIEAEITGIIHIKDIKDRKFVEELNLLTIRSLFSPLHDSFKKISTDAVKTGFIIDKMDKPDSKKSYYTMILNICHKLDLTTTNELIDFVNTNNHDSYKYFQSQYNAESQKWTGSNEFILLLFMMKFLNNRELEDIRIGWHDRIWNRVLEVISKFHND